MADTNASRRKGQGRSLGSATNWGEPWAAHEVDMVKAFPGELAGELALALGRTQYAVEAVRQALADGRPVGGGHGTSQPTARPQPTYTYVGTDYPPGHFD